MRDPLRELARTRREAQRFAADARALASRRRSRLPVEVRADVERTCAEVERAVVEGDVDRLSVGLGALDALWDQHLARLEKPAWRAYGEAILLAALLAAAVRVVAVEGYRISSSSMAPTLVAGDHVLVSKLAFGFRVPFTGGRVWSRREPRRGDVVVFESPREPGRSIVKRVVGVPGDVVELRDGALHVNGIAQPRSLQGEIAWEEGPDDFGGPFSGTCRRYRESLARGALVAPERGDAAALERSWHTASEAGVATYDVMECRVTATRLAAREGPYTLVAPGHLFVLGDNRDRSADSRAAGGWQVPIERVTGKVVMVLFSWPRGGEWSRAGRRTRLERLFKPVE